MNEALTRGLRTIGRMMLRGVGGVVVVALGYLVLTQTGCYFIRAGWEEGKILKHRRSISDMVNDSATAPAVRQKLRLVLEARAFGADSIHLNAGRSFTKFTALESDTLVLVLSGAYRDQLKPKTWWFPIVGRVPYKGFFDVESAKRAAATLDADGFDVYLRPASAFSTLGWFNDPLLSTTLRSDSLELANTIIHEITHNTFYAGGHADFNESFANFVGARGAAWFFRSHGYTAAAEEVEARWNDEKVMAGFWAGLYASIDSAFKAHPNERDARLAARDTIYRAGRVTLVNELGPNMRTIRPRTLERMRLDNGALLAHRIYLTDVAVFDELWEKQGRNLPATVSRIIELAKSDPKHPFDAVRNAIAKPSAPKPTP